MGPDMRAEYLYESKMCVHTPDTLTTASIYQRFFLCRTAAFARALAGGSFPSELLVFLIQLPGAARVRYRCDWLRFRRFAYGHDRTAPGALRGLVGKGETSALCDRRILDAARKSIARRNGRALRTGRPSPAREMGHLAGDTPEYRVRFKTRLHIFSSQSG